MNRTIRPPNYLETLPDKMIFLAGPIQSAEDWQETARRTIHLMAPNIYVASPRRLEADNYKNKDFTEEMFNEQVDWETYHLRKAADKGAILFWLAKEYRHLCDRAYAQTTRFELAEWKINHENTKCNLVLGIEDEFTGSRYIKRRFMQDCPDVPISSSLEDACMAAVVLTLRK